MTGEEQEENSGGVPIKHKFDVLVRKAEETPSEPASKAPGASVDDAKEDHPEMQYLNMIREVIEDGDERMTGRA